MSDETLLSASRRLVRFLNIDNNKEGGLIAHETQTALDTLTQQIAHEDRLMRDTTLLAYAKDATNRLQIDINKGGFTTEGTQWAIDQLDREVRRVTVAIKLDAQETT